MFGIGAQELAVILVVALLVFGPKRLPELARSLGKGLAEFRRASSDLRQGLSLEDEPQRRTTPRPTSAAQAGVEPPDAHGDEENKIAPPTPDVSKDPAEPVTTASGHADDGASGKTGG